MHTTLAPRAQILDASGQSLQPLSTAYELGVRPDKLADPRATAIALSAATGLGASSLLAAIQSGPSRSFLPLVTLDPPTYARMRHGLHGVPGLAVKQVKRRLFDSIAGDVVGTVGTEVAHSFRAEGVAYEPGNTVGLSGLQQYYQRRLVGTPTTEVVVEHDNGHLVSVLSKWSGPAAQPVRTTLSSSAQIAVDQALVTTSSPAAIVAVQASTGKILAVGSQGGADPLDGHYSPGQAFTIVSTAALLGTGLSARASVPCNSASDVGGETFTNHPSAHSLGSQPTFSKDFAYGCGTAFAGLSMRLNASGLSTAAADFGLGSSWQLSLPTFGGSVLAPATTAQVAADSMGSGDVQVSPLGMAMVAAQVDSGTWHDPSLILDPAPAGPPDHDQGRHQVHGQPPGHDRSARPHADRRPLRRRPRRRPPRRPRLRSDRPRPGAHHRVRQPSPVQRRHQRPANLLVRRLPRQHSLRHPGVRQAFYLRRPPRRSIPPPPPRLPPHPISSPLPASSHPASPFTPLAAVPESLATVGSVGGWRLG